MSAPTFAIWLLSTILAAIVILTVYAGVNVPVATDLIAGRHFETLMLAYVLLWLGTIFRGF